MTGPRTAIFTPRSSFGPRSTDRSHAAFLSYAVPLTRPIPVFMMANRNRYSSATKSEAPDKQDDVDHERGSYRMREHELGHAER